MLRQPTASDIRLNKITTCLTATVELLTEVNNAFGTPFLQAVCITTSSLITVVQNVKKNKEDCIELMENIYVTLDAIATMHLNPDTAGSIPPATLHSIGKFTETLYKIHTFVEGQAEGYRLKRLLRHSEMNTLLKECRADLQDAQNIFRIETPAILSVTIDEMRDKTEAAHRDLLELISSLSDGTVSDGSSSIYREINNSGNSSSSFSLLPSRPKIFHGRDSELNTIVNIFSTISPRIAILGGAGMGKTSLARAVLHHPAIMDKHQQRFFVAAESATNSIELASQVGLAIGLKPSKDITKAVIRYFSEQSSCLLIVDNLETPWEPIKSRAGIEEFLSLLTDVPHLALIITMRGAERPGKIRWTHPFLPPLQPLSDDAARQTFIDIAEDWHHAEAITQLLRLTDNMPLAVDLIAHLVDYEGCSSVLSRWETERTSLLSAGSDRRSSLDVSITVSLSSPRITSNPGATELLRLLSILPDGLSDVELVESKLPIQGVLRCKATLVGTSLAYLDSQKRLRALFPIREYMQQFYPPSPPLIRPLQNHFHLLLDLYQKYRGNLQIAGRMDQIGANLGNLHQVLQHGLQSDDPDTYNTIKCIITLNHFTRVVGLGYCRLIDRVPAFLPQFCDYKLEAQFITEVLRSYAHHPHTNIEMLIDQAKNCFKNITDPILESQFHDALGTYYVDMKNNISSGMESLEMALQLARTAGDLNQQATILIQIAWITWMTGDHTASQSNAQEAQRISSLSGNLVNVAKALRLEAMGCGNQSDYKRAISLLHRARGLLELCGMSQGYLDKQAMISEAQVYLLKSEYGEARAIHTQIVQNTSVDQDPSTHAFSLLSIAEIDSIIGAEGSQVHQGLRKAEMLFKSIEYSVGVGYCQTIVADLSLRNGDPLTANDLFQQCLNKFWGKNVDAVSYCLERLADGRRWMVDNFAWRSTWTIVYLAHAQKSKENLHLHNALLFLGDIFLSLGDEDTAHSLFIVGLDGFTVMDVHQNRAQCMLRLGDIAKNRGDHSHAIDLWKKAKPLFERSLQTKDLAGIEARLDAVNRNNPPALLNLQNLNVPKNAVEGNGIRTEKDLIVVAEGTGKGASVAA